MRRCLFTFFSAVSLLLCVAVCVLWVRTYDYWTDRLERYDPHWGWGLYLAGGRVSCLWYVTDETTQMMPKALWHERRRTMYDFHSPLTGSGTAFRFAGFQYESLAKRSGFTYWHAV